MDVLKPAWLFVSCGFSFGLDQPALTIFPLREKLSYV